MPYIDKIIKNSVEYDIKSKETYSTEEQVIGTWIDGKPFYRKVIQINTGETVNAWVNITNNLGASEVLSVNGYCYRPSISASEYKILGFHASTQIYFQLNKGTGELQEAHTNNADSNIPIVIIIEYTKIAD